MKLSVLPEAETAVHSEAKLRGRQGAETIPPVVGGFISPLERYPDLPGSTWTAPWRRTACIVTAEDGTWGLGVTIHGGPVERVINGHFAPVLSGQSCLATEKLWDTMQRIGSGQE